MSDLADLAFDDAAVMVIKDQSGHAMKNGKNEMGIEFYSPDSNEYKEAFKVYRMAIMAANGNSAEILNAECRLVSDCTKSFNNVIFNKAEAQKKDAMNIYKGVSIVRSQAVSFLVNEANFINGGAMS